MSSDDHDELLEMLDKAMEEVDWDKIAEETRRKSSEAQQKSREAYFERRYQAERLEREYQHWKEEKDKDERRRNERILYLIIIIAAIGVCLLTMITTI
jgi:hypothetical protein